MTLTPAPAVKRAGPDDVIGDRFLAITLKRRLAHWVALHVGVPIAYVLHRLIGWTLRRSRQGYHDRFRVEVAAGRRFICAFWHDDSLHLALEMRSVLGDGDLYIMSSPGRDGALMTRFLEMAGARVAKGSTTHRGGRALLEMIRAMTPRDFAAMAVDGSRRCPRFSVQQGVLLLAQRTGLPIVPIAARASRKWIVGSKDRIEIPFPWAKVTLIYGETLEVPADADAAALEVLRARLERQLREMKGVTPSQKE